MTAEDAEQFPGWPVKISSRDNDGRAIVGYLPELNFANAKSPVVQVIHNASKEVVYTIRAQGDSFRPPVYGSGNYTISIGRDQPGEVVLNNISPAKPNDEKAQLRVEF